MSDPDPVQLHTAASALFGEQVGAVQAHEWDLPTPCVDWNVRQVVAHVVLGDSQIPPLFAGERVDRVVDVNPGILGTNPLATWRGTAIGAISAFAAVDDLAAKVHHPIGEVRGDVVLGFRISDNLVHGWDIAQAVTRPIELPDDLADWCLDFWQPMAASLPSSGYFAEALHPGADATPGARLLGLLGRTV